MNSKALIITTLMTAALLGGTGTALAKPPPNSDVSVSGEASAQAYRCGFYDGTVTFRRGDVGNAVKEIQCLINLGYYTPELRVDGEFGPNTEAAVKWYQRCSGISADGVVGPNTWYQLRNNSNC